MGDSTDNAPDDLVKRLRKGDHFEKVMSAEQAANRIEKLEAEMKWADEISNIQAARIEELEANINTKADFIDATINQLAASDQRIEELSNCVAVLEAKLAKAVEVLDQTRIVLAEHEPHPLPVLSKVLAALAALEGGKTDG